MITQNLEDINKVQNFVLTNRQVKISIIANEMAIS